jgi:sec-independent protein translocase protein TatC
MSGDHPVTDPAADAELTHVAPEDDVQMTIWEHLGELRNRLFKSAAAVLAGAVGCWTYREELVALIAQPYKVAWATRFPHDPVVKLQTLAPADIFVNYMQLAMTGGIVLAIPVIFYQLWAFVSPGLYSREKRYIIPFVLFSTLLFMSGVAFAYFVAFPFSFNYFLSLLGQVGGSSGIELTSIPTMEYYLDFTTRMGRLPRRALHRRPRRAPRRARPRRRRRSRSTRPRAIPAHRWIHPTRARPSRTISSNTPCSMRAPIRRRS